MPMKESHSKTKQEYEDITRLIDTEKEKKMDQLISALVSLEQRENKETNSKEKSSEDRLLKNDDEYIAMISLLSLRIKAGCELIRSGLSDMLGQFKEDIEELLSYVQSLEYEWKISETVRSDAYDLLRAVCLPEDRLIIDQNYQWNLLNTTVNGITPEMFFLFTEVSKYMRNIDRLHEAVNLLEFLCFYSRTRVNPEHKELVIRAITQICDDSPETTCRICDIDQCIFADEITLYSGDFYWFYGNSLLKLDRTEDALHAYEKCFQIRKAILGETDYYTEVTRRERAICKFSLTKGHEGREDLKRFVDRIEEGFFINDIDHEQLQILEAKTLCTLLMDLSEISNPDEYKKYLKIYGRLCLKYEYTGEPCISMRMAWNMRGGYYMCIGDYIQAESAFLNALKVDVNDEKKSIISRTQIQSNLLLIYYVQNDLEKAYPLAADLLDQIENDESEESIKDTDIYRIYTLLVSMEIQTVSAPVQEELDDIANLLKETCEDILSGDTLKAPREEAIFAIICIFFIIQHETSTVSDQKQFSLVLHRIELEKRVFDFAPMQLTILYYCQALLLWNIGEKDAGDYFEKAINCLDKSGIQHNLKSAVYQSYGAFLCKRGEFNSGLQYIERSLNEITITWHQYVRYLNDTRLLMILTPVQLMFTGCYAILRQITDISTSYERLLQFKALASLAGRERNRIIHGRDFNPELLDKIQRIQNTIATLESENMLRDVERDYEKQAEELRRMEKDFAVQFPHNAKFTNISLKAVQDAIPDDSAVLEYFFTTDSYGQTQFEYDDSVDRDPSVFDVYITTKESGRCSLHRITISNGLEVVEDAQSFVLIMQHISAGEATIEELEKLDILRFRLYNAIISPVLDYIEGYGTVYIAPDNELINLPFDLLYNEDKTRLADWHNCVKIECARDFLFGTTDTPSNKGTLIVSDPEYEVRERIVEPDRKTLDGNERQRALNLDIDKLNSLPFSKVEAYRISSRIGGELYTGVGATKQVVLSAKGYENIHIATHGYFDIDNEYASLYSSCLVFTGIKKWYRTGRINPIYGSGVLTADEVSRMDLSSTNLVVLSSCLSGMNDILFSTGFYGMVSALSAAGAKYVVSNLWSVNDLASAVFMDAFYYYYANGWNTPPVALSKARDYLRSVTIDELKRQGWFHPTTYQMLDADSRNFLYSLENKNGKLKPFRNESFWGGFTCYECH